MRKYKILIINYYYPPMISGGVQRTFNFMKFLPQYGVDASIVTNNSYGVLKDDEKKGVYRFPDRGYDFTHSSRNFPILIFLFRAFRRAQVYMGFITDGKYYWKTEVLRDVDNIIEKNGFDAVLASYPSPANFEIGEYIHNKYGLPIITDFRDGIIFEPFQGVVKDFPLARKRLGSIEKRLMKISSLNLTVNEEMNNYFVRNYPNVKSVLISNGFDDEEEIVADPLSLPDGINVVYTGGIAKSRIIYDFDTIFATLDKLFSSENGVNYIFVGDYFSNEIKFFAKFDNVYVYPETERQVVLATQRVADAFLLISGPKGGTSGKLYEYLFAEKPIINIGGNAGIAEMINGITYGITLEPSNIERAGGFLKKLKDGTLSLKYPFQEKFTRRHQSEILAGEIITLLDRTDDN